MTAITQRFDADGGSEENDEEMMMDEFFVPSTSRQQPQVQQQQQQQIEEFDELVLLETDDQEEIQEDSDESFRPTVEVHARHMMAYFMECQQRNAFCDVELRIDGVTTGRYHSVVLAAFSSALEHTLTTEYRKKKHGNVAIALSLDTKILGTTKAAIEDWLNFAYTGECTVSEKSRSVAKILKSSTLAEVLENQPDDYVVLDAGHSLHLLKCIQSFRRRQLFQDCQIFHINSKGQRSTCCRAMRIVMGAFSSFFDRAFEETMQDIFVELEVDERPTSIAADHLKALLDFVYVARLRKFPFRMKELAQAAQTLQIGRAVLYIEASLAWDRSEREFEKNNDIADKESALAENQPSTEFDRLEQQQQQTTTTNPSLVVESSVTSTSLDGLGHVYSEFVIGPSNMRRRAVRVVAKNSGVQNLVASTNAKEDDRRFKCNFCAYAARERSSLNKHVRSRHTHETPYSCHLCGQKFKILSNQIRHVRAHTGEKPYACRKCGVSYADKKNMDAHIFRVHLQVEPMPCPVTGCTSRFYRKDRLGAHMKKAHPELVRNQQQNQAQELFPDN